MIKRIKGRILLHQSDPIKKIKLQFESEIKDIHEYISPRALGEGSIQIKNDDICMNEKEQFR